MSHTIIPFVNTNLLDIKNHLYLDVNLFDFSTIILIQIKENNFNIYNQKAFEISLIFGVIPSMVNNLDNDSLDGLFTTL